MSQQELDKVLVDMLTENTGTHMLDSGSAYGRHWEENQEFGDKVEQWKNRDKFNVEVYPDHEEVHVTVDIFHFLRNHLERDDKSEEIEQKFYEFANRPEREREGWYACIKQMFGNRGVNTYNRETNLSQVLQYAMFSEEEARMVQDERELPDSVADIYDNEYLMLQIHNGCDVRGGYTKPRVFRLDAVDYFLLHMTDLNASCECSNGYSDDCGYHWYEIPEFEFKKIEDGDDKVICSECGHEVEFYAPLEY